jgi:hypothetical protein
MPKITVDIPSDVKDIISKHSELNWNKIITDTLWSYAKKLKLLDSITSKSKISEKDVDEIDSTIKQNILKKYHN